MSSREGTCFGAAAFVSSRSLPSRHVCAAKEGQAAHEEPQLTEMDDPGLRRCCVWLRGGGCGP